MQISSTSTSPSASSSFSFLLTVVDDDSFLGEECGVVLVYSEPQFRHRVVGVEVGPFRFLEVWGLGVGFG